MTFIQMSQDFVDEAVVGTSHVNFP